MNRSILLADMNAFFAQVEAKENPHLRGKPLFVTGSDNPHTIVTTCSYEARPFGVRSGMSLHEALRLCPHAVIIEGNQDRYLDYSKRLLRIYQNFTDQVEPYSIDEAFIDVTGVRLLHGDAKSVAVKIKKQMREKTGLTCSIGIGPNKLLAKMAANQQKPDGLVEFAPEQVPEVIWHLHVEKLVGVGSRMKEHLNRRGIFTIEQLAKHPSALLRSAFGKYGEMLHQAAWGVDENPVNPDGGCPVKSMGHSYTFPRDVKTDEDVRRWLLLLSDKVAKRLRGENLWGKTITLTVRGTNYATFTRSLTLPAFTDSPHEIQQTAFCLFGSAWNWKQNVRLLGVSVSGLSKKKIGQLSWLKDYLREKKLLRAIDRINNRHGEYSITFASLLPHTQAGKRLRKKTGCFMTREEKTMQF